MPNLRQFDGDLRQFGTNLHFGRQFTGNLANHKNAINALNTCVFSSPPSQRRNTIWQTLYVTGQTPLSQKGQSFLSCDPTVFSSHSDAVSPKTALRRSSPQYALRRSHTFTSTRFHPLCVRFLMCVSAVASPTFLMSFLLISDRQKTEKARIITGFFPCGAIQTNGLTGVWVGDRPCNLLRLLTPSIRRLMEGNEKLRCHPHAAPAAHPHPFLKRLLNNFLG